MPSRCCLNDAPCCDLDFSVATPQDEKYYLRALGDDARKVCSYMLHIYVKGHVRMRWLVSFQFRGINILPRHGIPELNLSLSVDVLLACCRCLDFTSLHLCPLKTARMVVGGDAHAALYYNPGNFSATVYFRLYSAPTI